MKQGADSAENISPADEPMIVESEVREIDMEAENTGVQPIRSLGAIPKKRLVVSVEALESHQAQAELENYLQGAEKQTQ